MTDENLNVAACRHSMRINGNKMKKTTSKQCFGSGCGLAPDSRV
jgi:hypothetical protein